MGENERLSTELTQVNGIPLLRVQGEIDLYTAPEFEQAVQAGIGQVTRAFIVDLSDISYLDSAGLGVLLAAYRVLATRNGELHVVAPTEHPGVSRVLEITRMNAIIHVHNSVGDALRELSLKEAA